MYCMSGPSLHRESTDSLIRSPIENVWKKLAVHESVCNDAANSKGQPSVRQSHQFGVLFTPTCHIEDAFL